jgi:hypothetical protein
MALGHSFEVFAQEIVDALLATPLVDFHPSYRFFA